MATDRRFTRRRVAALIVAVALLVPVVVAWLDPVLLGGLDGATVVRLVGLGVVLALVARWVVRQRGHDRGGRLANRPDSNDAERRANVEGTGDEYLSYVYNSQVEATREGDRITEEAERLAEADREARRRD